MAFGDRVTLRARVLVGSVVAFVALLVMGLVLFLQYSATAVVAQAVHDALSPAADATASITLDQANASGSLSDYIMLDRPASFTEYRTSIARASTLLDEVEQMLPESLPDVRALVDTARSKQADWIATDAAPVISLMERGKSERAMKASNSPEAWASYDAMTEASNALNQAVNDERDSAAKALSTVNSWLGASLIVVGALILTGLAFFIFGLQRWILRPLNHLRADLQSATLTPGHEAPIADVGPPELRAVAVDAEALRRGLVREIDEARAAREGLTQDAPLVAAMAAELAAPAQLNVDGVRIFGTSQSAEGVMAGDWWDPIQRPDGSLCLVVADVSGHGPNASVTAVRVRAILRSGLEAGLPPEQVVSMAAQSCSRDTHFVTGIILVVDATARRLTWVNAGHHPAIVVSHDKDASLCDPTGPLISSLGGTWTSGSMPFAPGDVVVAYTDGLVESRNADGDELESAVVAQFIRGADAWVREDPEELISRLLAQVRHRAADWRRDDVTVVAASLPRM
jgi:serine phosphatase RsbU (regulator of sigma subunit)/CHASE3 domain sensor protein